MRLAQMLQAAEDVLNLLSQEGVFVDELPMAPVDAAAWRRFMAGRRGAGGRAASAGSATTRALEAARGLMRSDSIFRDSALFFQRRFDGVLWRVLPRGERRRDRGAGGHAVGAGLHAAGAAERVAGLTGAA